jgi:hypothetical protein
VIFIQSRKDGVVPQFENILRKDAKGTTLQLNFFAALRKMKLIHYPKAHISKVSLSLIRSTAPLREGIGYFFFAGTFAPLSLASDKPIAIACFGFVTLVLLFPLFSLPSFISCIALSTFC